MPKVFAIIQARTGSTRLPGKVLLKVCGKTLLQHQLERVKRATSLDGVVVATTDHDRDTPIADIAKYCGVDVFRGSEHDVLDRYARAASQAGADVIVRITADCPCLDPKIIDLVVQYYLGNTDLFAYVSNVRPPTFPDGMDVEVFSREALDVSAREAQLPSEREHVTSYIAKHSDRFRIGNVQNDADFSAYRLTVDELSDWELVRRVFEVFGPNAADFSMKDIIDLLTQRPELVMLNKHIASNEGYQKSLAEDEKFIKKKHSDSN
jgi:spore coat polysaccharide biosynthesis protein SpsF